MDWVCLCTIPQSWRRIERHCVNFWMTIWARCDWTRHRRAACRRTIRDSPMESVCVCWWDWRRSSIAMCVRVWRGAPCAGVRKRRARPVRSRAYCTTVHTTRNSAKSLLITAWRRVLIAVLMCATMFIVCRACPTTTLCDRSFTRCLCCQLTPPRQNENVFMFILLRKQSTSNDLDNMRINNIGWMKQQLSQISLFIYINQYIY